MARARINGVLTAFCLMLAFWTAPSLAEPADVGPREGAAIRSTIQAQLDAFRRDDAGAAFAAATPAIRALFGTAAAFMDMVRAGYAPVYRAREVEFRELVTSEGGPFQTVLLTGPDGVSVIAAYRMARQPDGSWKIDGCVLAPTSDRSI